MNKRFLPVAFNQELYCLTCTDQREVVTVSQNSVKFYVSFLMIFLLIFACKTAKANSEGAEWCEE